MKINKILVPTDFSEEANNALEVAVTIAKRANAEISLLNVIDVPVVGHYDSMDIMHTNDTGDDRDLHKAYMLRLMEVTKAKINMAKEQYSDVNITEHVVFDSLDKQLFEFVVKDKTDLIVMGSKGSNGVQEFWVGSHTQKVIQYAKTPVLTVKSRMENYDVKNLVFASNFFDIPNNVIDSIKTIQGLFNAKIHFVKITTVNTFDTTINTNKLMQRFAKSNNFENYTINTFNAYTEEDGIRGFAESIDADLMMMMTHGRTGLARLIWGSIAEEVANHSIKPVLTFNNNNTN